MYRILLVSTQSFQVEYLTTGLILNINYTGFGGNYTAKFIDYQILANTLISKWK